MKFSHMVFSVSPPLFSLVSISVKYVTQNALGGDLRGHVGAIG